MYTVIYIFLNFRVDLNFDKNYKANTETFHILHTEFFLIINILMSHNHMMYFSPLMSEYQYLNICNCCC